MSLVLVGLFVMTIAAPASADDASKYFPPQRVAEDLAMYKASYTGCLEWKREYGWNSREAYVGCSWFHSYMRANGRVGRATDPIIR
jgi:hypothetical protein